MMKHGVSNIQELTRKNQVSDKLTIISEKLFIYQFYFRNFVMNDL